MITHLITLMLLFPFIGAMIQALAPKEGSARWRWSALAASLASGICGLILIASMSAGTSEVQGLEQYPWIGSYAISYEMGVDGLNALLVLLISIVFPILIATEWKRKDGVRGIQGLLLLLQASFVGTVCAQDLFLMFFFWALSALPFYFLIGIWGGEDRESAAIHAISASSIGNALLFLALVIVYYSVDPHTFRLRDLIGMKFGEKNFEIFGLSVSVSNVAFVLIGVGLALRVPVWPVHGWFTRVAKGAPSSVFACLCSITIPISAYLFIRLTYSLFPDTLAAFAPVVVALGAINLVVGGICALGQTQLRTLLAYLALCEMGLLLIGVGSLSSAGIVGTVCQQMATGLGLAGFGIFVGFVTDRFGHCEFTTKNGEARFGGIAARAPFLGLFVGIVLVSLLGFPGSIGFVGHALLYLGSYSRHPWIVVISGAMIILAAYTVFSMYRSFFLGAPAAAGREFMDLSNREKAILFPLLVAIVVFGLYPRPLIELVRPTVLTLLSVVQ